MPSLPGRILLLLPVALLPAGCEILRPAGKSPLATPQMSSDSVVLECFFARCSFGDPQMNEQLWQEVDEQHFPADLRRRLERNGFRVGLIDGQLPVALSKLLELKDKPAPTGGATEVNVGDLDPKRPERRHMSLRTGQASRIAASGVYERLPVLIREDGQLCGQTYSKAQGLLAVTAFAQRDGRVRLELAPELHHGQPRQRWVGEQGMLRLEAGRARRMFDELAFSATLSPGSLLLISSLPDRPGSLGHHFFTAGEGHHEQKLLVVRVAQTQHDDLFLPVDVLVDE